MRSAQNVHPEFGLWSNLRREAGVAASKSQKAVRSPNQRNKGWYDAAAWGGYAHQRPSSSW